MPPKRSLLNLMLNNFFFGKTRKIKGNEKENLSTFAFFYRPLSHTSQRENENL